MNYDNEIKKILLAARCHSAQALREARFYMDKGIAEVDYKDLEEFDCSSRDQYIYNEMAHVIDDYSLDLEIDDRVAILESARGNHEGAWLPSNGETCFRALDASDAAAWLERQGYQIESYRDTGSNGLAVTRCGMAVSTNGRVFDHRLHLARFATH